MKNGPSVSISFSITFRTAASERQELLYKASARLRKLGLTPTPVGRSILLDRTKQLAFGAAAGLKRALLPAPPKSLRVATGRIFPARLLAHICEGRRERVP